MNRFPVPDVIAHIADAARILVPHWEGEVVLRPVVDTQGIVPSGEFVGTDVCLALAEALGKNPSVTAQEIIATLAARGVSGLTECRGFVNISLDRLQPCSWAGWYAAREAARVLHVLPRGPEVRALDFFRVVCAALVQARALTSFGTEALVKLGGRDIPIANDIGPVLVDCVRSPPISSSIEAVLTMTADPATQTVWFAPGTFSNENFRHLVRLRKMQRSGVAAPIRVPPSSWFDGGDEHELSEVLARCGAPAAPIAELLFCAAAPWASRDIDWSAALRSEQANALWYWREVATRFLRLTEGVSAADVSDGDSESYPRPVLCRAGGWLGSHWAAAAREGSVSAAHEQTTKVFRELHRFLHDPQLRGALGRAESLDPWQQIITGVRGWISDMLSIDGHFLGSTR